MVALQKAGSTVTRDALLEACERGEHRTFTLTLSVLLTLTVKTRLNPGPDPDPDTNLTLTLVHLLKAASWLSTSMCSALSQVPILERLVSRLPSRLLAALGLQFMVVARVQEYFIGMPGTGQVGLVRVRG